jgi:hypothetical protein
MFFHIFFMFFFCRAVFFFEWELFFVSFFDFVGMGFRAQKSVQETGFPDVVVWRWLFRTLCQQGAELTAQHAANVVVVVCGGFSAPCANRWLN